LRMFQEVCCYSFKIKCVVKLKQNRYTAMPITAMDLISHNQCHYRGLHYQGTEFPHKLFSPFCRCKHRNSWTECLRSKILVWSPRVINVAVFVGPANVRAPHHLHNSTSAPLCKYHLTDRLYIVNVKGVRQNVIS